MKFFIIDNTKADGAFIKAFWEDVMFLIEPKTVDEVVDSEDEADALAVLWDGKDGDVEQMINELEATGKPMYSRVYSE